MWDFYDNFYRATAASAAHREFCTRVFGLDLCQHGFADVTQLDALMVAAQLRPGQRVLDLGCGVGLIAEYLADRSGAHVTGLDYVPDAIRQAPERTQAQADRLDFFVGDINALALPPAAYDVIMSIDTIYFSDNFSATIAALAPALRPGGRLAFLYSHGREPWVPIAEFDVGTLPAAHTPLARALTANGFRFTFTDFSADDLRLAIRRQEVLADLRAEFEAEGNLFIYENRLGDANGIRGAYEEGLQRRYLYIATSTASARSSLGADELSIRPATADDVPALTELAVATYTAAFGHAFTPEDLAAHLARNLAAGDVARFVAEDVVLVAEAGGRLVGFVQFGTAGPEYAPAHGQDQELRRLYVLGEFQNQGAGTRLMQAALAHPQFQRAPAIYLDVWEHNHGAQRFYRRHGFAVVGTRKFAVASGAETSLDLIMARRS